MKSPKPAPLPARDLMFIRTYRACGGNVARVAETLGLSRQSVYLRLDNLKPDVFYILPLGDGRYYQAVAVHHGLRRMWIATGKMSISAALAFARKKEVPAVRFDGNGEVEEQAPTRAVFDFEANPKAKKTRRQRR